MIRPAKLIICLFECVRSPRNLHSFCFVLVSKSKIHGAMTVYIYDEIVLGEQLYFEMVPVLAVRTFCNLESVHKISLEKLSNEHAASDFSN